MAMADDESRDIADNAFIELALWADAAHGYPLGSAWALDPKQRRFECLARVTDQSIGVPYRI
jgi:hypothetical protein